MTPNDCFAVAHHCCNDDQQSNWENDDWNPWKFSNVLWLYGYAYLLFPFLS